MRKFTIADLMWLMLYTAFVGATVWLMNNARVSVEAAYGSPQAQAEWSKWRSEAAAGAGPVQRRAPKSAEPPALVLMRDYFAACLTIMLLLGTALFVTFMFILRGLFASRRPGERGVAAKSG